MIPSSMIGEVFVWHWEYVYTHILFCGQFKNLSLLLWFYLVMAAIKKSMYLTPPHIYSWTPSHCKSKYRYDMVLILQLWSCKICPCIFNTRIFKICFCHLNYIANLKPWFLFFWPTLSYAKDSESLFTNRKYLLKIKNF